MEKLSQKSIKKGFNFKSFFKEWGLIFFILIIIAIASAKRPAFLSGSNLINILRSYSTIGIAALGRPTQSSRAAWICPSAPLFLCPQF